MADSGIMTGKSFAGCQQLSKLTERRIFQKIVFRRTNRPFHEFQSTFIGLASDNMDCRDNRLNFGDQLRPSIQWPVLDRRSTPNVKSNSPRDAIYRPPIQKRLNLG